MGRVFLSYARDDLRRAGKLAEALEAAGHEVWWDSRLKGGSEYSREIDEALGAADAVVVLWSATSVQSEWVRDEAAVGKQSGRLVPATIDGTEAPLGFRQHHTINLSGRGQAGLTQLVDAVAERTGQDPSRPAVSKPFKNRTRWWMAAAAALVLLAVAAAFLLRGSLFTERQVSLAVLPFADLSPAGDKAYFAEGVAEEILSTLAAEPGIRVLGRTSARMVERGADPKWLRRQLGVTHLLEGSARSAGDQLRVNVRLIDTTDGRQLWEEEYQGRPADVFAVQDQIAGAVVQRLRGTFFSTKTQRQVKATTVNAYQTYLAARALMRTRSEKPLSEALGLAEQVVQADPNYAPGQALLAELVWMLSEHPRAYGRIPVVQARKRGQAHAKAAIRLAPMAADGYAALGLVLPAEQAIEPLERAIRLDPSRADARVWLAQALNYVGRHDEALEHYRVAAEIEPLWAMPLATLTQALAASGRQDEGLRLIRGFRQRGGSEAQAHRFLFLMSHWSGDLNRAIADGKAGLAKDPTLPDLRLGMAIDYHIVGLAKQAPGGIPPELTQFMGPFYSADLAALRRKITVAGPRAWDALDGQLAFLHLTGSRDWSALVALYDARRFPIAEMCGKQPPQIFAVAIALREKGRERESAAALKCLRQQVSREARMKARNPYRVAGSLEFDRATLAGFDASRADALRSLEEAVDRGWLGRPYSSRLNDYPQFDGVRSDPRVAALQRRIDAKIAKERGELLAQR